MADFSTFIQDEFATDPVFKTELKNQVSAKDNSQELYDQYSLSDLFTLSNLFYEDVLNAYIPMDLANLILTQGKTQVIADLYQCDATKLIEALLLEDAAAFITEIDNANPAVTAALCQIHFGGACPNGPAIDLATVNAATLAVDINAQPSNDIKTAIGQLANTVIANAIANHTSSNWLADQIVLCGSSTTYQGYLNTDAINAKNHLMSSMGYAAILQRILDNDAAGMMDKVINLGHVYDYISNAQVNTSTLTMSAYHIMVANHANYGQTVLDKVISDMQDMVTDYELALKLNEHHLYGSARLGVQKQDLTLWQRNFTGSFTSGLHNYAISANNVLDIPALDNTTFKNRRGSKRFELANHLGNVLAVISDRKLAVDDNSNGQWDYYTADIASAQDYYPFGMQMPGRAYSNSAFVNGYRYTFQGQEGDDEWNGDGNSYAFKYRIHDSRIGRFLSIDPLTKKYPFYSPYAFSGNRVVDMIELEGLEPEAPKSEWSGKTSEHDDSQWYGSMYALEDAKGKFWIFHLTQSQFDDEDRYFWMPYPYEEGQGWKEFTPTPVEQMGEGVIEILTMGPRLVYDNTTLKSEGSLEIGVGDANYYRFLGAGDGAKMSGGVELAKFQGLEGFYKIFTMDFNDVFHEDLNGNGIPEMVYKVTLKGQEGLHAGGISFDVDESIRQASGSGFYSYGAIGISAKQSVDYSAFSPTELSTYKNLKLGTTELKGTINILDVGRELPAPRGNPGLDLMYNYKLEVEVDLIGMWKQFFGE